MNTPTPPVQKNTLIQSAFNKGEVYEVTLQDGTILWIPQNENNNDCAHVEAWAETNNIEL